MTKTVQGMRLLLVIFLFPSTKTHIYHIIFTRIYTSIFIDPCSCSSHLQLNKKVKSNIINHFHKFTPPKKHNQKYHMYLSKHPPPPHPNLPKQKQKTRYTTTQREMTSIFQKEIHDHLFDSLYSLFLLFFLLFFFHFASNLEISLQNEEI